MRIFHGSEFIIENPVYGKGKPYNDYGLGFYCTENIELAKEWGCDESHDGYANIYDLNICDLNILYLNSDKYNVLHWITILLNNRTFIKDSQIAKDAFKYLNKNFSIDTSQYDVIVGYRADDSYFSFAQDFLNNTISVNKLSKAMKLGNPGEQIVLVSKKAFENITFVGYDKVDKKTYYCLKEKRDKAARESYKNEEKSSYGKDELYIIDIIRQEVKENDPRL